MATLDTLHLRNECTLQRIAIISSTVGLSLVLFLLYIDMHYTI